MVARLISITFVVVGSMIMQYIDFVRFYPAQLKGRVVDARTGKPVQRAHVYLVHGEEEDFTSVRGVFQLRTSGSFPLQVSVECPGYQARTFDCTSAQEDVQLAIQPVN